MFTDPGAIRMQMYWVSRTCTAMFFKSIIFYTKVADLCSVKVICTVTRLEFIKNINLMLAKPSIRCRATAQELLVHGSWSVVS